MKAAVLRKVNEPLSIENISIDGPKDNEVLVQTKASGVCRTDLHYIEGNYTHQLPVILGHEVSGVVKQVGDNVKYLKKGDIAMGIDKFGKSAPYKEIYEEMNLTSNKIVSLIQAKLRR